MLPRERALEGSGVFSFGLARLQGSPTAGDRHVAANRALAPRQRGVGVLRVGCAPRFLWGPEA